MGKKGYWRSMGCVWDEGEVPECTFCGDRADKKDVSLYETAVNGIYLCEKKDCLYDFLMNECYLIEFYEND